MEKDRIEQLSRACGEAEARAEKELAALRGEVNALAVILRKLIRRQHLDRPQEDVRGKQGAVDEGDIEILTEIDRRTSV